MEEKIIEVTGCGDCPFLDTSVARNGEPPSCYLDVDEVWETSFEDCPLRNTTVTVKLVQKE
jgi:hypothetical protein